MPSGSEVLGNGPIGRQKTLGMSRRFESLHAILALARRPMGMLTAVIQIATLAVFHPGQCLTLGGTVALPLVRHDHTRHVLQAREQRAKKLLGGVLIATALHQNVEDIIILVDSAPQVMALPIDRQKQL